MRLPVLQRVRMVIAACHAAERAEGAKDTVSVKAPAAVAPADRKSIHEAEARPYTKALTHHQSRRTRTSSSTTERFCVLCRLSFWS